MPPAYSYESAATRLPSRKHRNSPAYSCESAATRPQLRKRCRATEIAQRPPQDTEHKSRATRQWRQKFPVK